MNEHAMELANLPPVTINSSFPLHLRRMYTAPEQRHFISFCFPLSLDIYLLESSSLQEETMFIHLCIPQSIGGAQVHNPLNLT